MAWGLNMLLVLVAGLYCIFHDHISVAQLAEIQSED